MHSSVFFWPSLYFLTSYQVLIQCINCACIAQKCVLYTSEVPLTSCSLVTSSLPPPSSLSSSSVCSILRVIWRKYIVYFQALDISMSIKPKKRNLAMLLVICNALEGHNFHFSGSFGLSLLAAKCQPTLPRCLATPG